MSIYLAPLMHVAHALAAWGQATFPQAPRWALAAGAVVAGWVGVFAGGWLLARVARWLPLAAGIALAVYIVRVA